MSKATVLVKRYDTEAPKQFHVNDYNEEVIVQDGVLYIKHGTTVTGFPLTSVDQFSIDKLDA